MRCSGIVFAPFKCQYHPANDEQQEHTEGDVSNQLGRMHGLRVEGHHDGMFAGRYLHGTQHVVGAQDVGRLTVDSGCPARIIDFREDDETVFCIVRLVGHGVGREGGLLYR